MANPTIDQLRTMFKNTAGDSSLTDTQIEYYLKDHYNDFSKDIWDSNVKGLVPLVVEKLPVTQDVNKGPYILLPNTTVVWRLLRNQQTEFVDDGTNYKIYMVRGYTDQMVEYVPRQVLPTGTTPAVYKDHVCRIIVMKAVADYYYDIKSYEEEQRIVNRIQDKMSDLRKGFKQEYVYSSLDSNEEIQVNVPGL